MDIDKTRDDLLVEFAYQLDNLMAHVGCRVDGDLKRCKDKMEEAIAQRDIEQREANERREKLVADLERSGAELAKDG